MQWKVQILRAQKNKWTSWGRSALQLGEGLQMMDGCTTVFLLDGCWAIVRRLIGVASFKRMYKCNCNVPCFAYSRKSNALLRCIQNQGIGWSRGILHIFCEGKIAPNFGIHKEAKPKDRVRLRIVWQEPGMGSSQPQTTRRVLKFWPRKPSKHIAYPAPTR